MKLANEKNEIIVPFFVPEETIKIREQECGECFEQFAEFYDYIDQRTVIWWMDYPKALINAISFFHRYAIQKGRKFLGIV